MGKSRFEALETAVRERNKVGTGNIDNQVKIQALKTQIANLEEDLNAKIKRIKNSPIDKEALKVKAQTDFDMAISQAENKVKLDKSNRMARFEAMVSDTKIARDETIANAERAFKKALRDQKTQEANNEIKDQESDRWLKEQKHQAEYNLKTALAAVEDSQETVNLQIQQARTAHKKETDVLNAKLSALQQAIELVEEQKATWEGLYKDIVEISKCSE